MKPQSNANFTMLSQRERQRTDAAYLEYRRQWMENPANFVLREFPIHLDIEASSRCNLDCTFCDKQQMMGRDEFGDLDFGLFTKIMDEAAGHGLCGLKLSYRGEPLLNPRLPEMIRYAKDRGVLDVYFNTNAMLLSRKLSARLVESGLDRISISIEGTDPVAYETSRRGAKFQRVVDNLRALAEVRAELGSITPSIRVQTVRLPGLDLEEYGRFWLQYADETACVDFKDAVNTHAGVEVPGWACPQLWQRMTITWNGHVMACNNDDFRFLSPGNARDRSILDCWTDARVRQAREMHRQGVSHRVKACDVCPWRAAQVAKLALSGAQGQR